MLTITLREVIEENTGWLVKFISNTNFFKVRTEYCMGYTYTKKISVSEIKVNWVFFSLLRLATLDSRRPHRSRRILGLGTRPSLPLIYLLHPCLSPLFPGDWCSSPHQLLKSSKDTRLGYKPTFQHWTLVIAINPVNYPLGVRLLPVLQRRKQAWRR